MTKHNKAFRCRIDNTGRIYRLKENWYVPISMTKPLQTTIDDILEKSLNENIAIKSEKGGSGSSRIANGEKNKTHLKSIGGTPEEGTTKWLRLIKSDETVWTVRTVNNEHYVGEKVQ